MLSIRLKALRTQQRKTQQEMADLLGITRQGYAKYENNLGEPDNSTLSKLADYFEVSTDYLLGRTDKIALTPQEKEKEEEVEFQAFANDPSLQLWYKELPKNREEDLQRLRKMWEILKDSGEI